LPWIPDELFWKIASALFPFFMVFFLFLALYRLVPNTYVSWKAAFWAALIASLGWEVTTNAFSWYLESGYAQYSLIYGTLGAFFALLTWIFLISLIIVFCAHLSAAIQHRQDADPPPPELSQPGNDRNNLAAQDES
jgi:membrane protein